MIAVDVGSAVVFGLVGGLTAGACFLFTTWRQK